MFYEFLVLNKKKIIIAICLLSLLLISIFIYFSRREKEDKIELFAIEVDVNTLFNSKVSYDEDYNTTLYLNKKTFVKVNTILENKKGKSIYISTNDEVASISSDGTLSGLKEGTAYIYSMLGDETSNYIKVVVY